MAINEGGFNIGQDASLVIQDSLGDIVLVDTLGHLMDFDSESEDVEIKITPISGNGIPIIQDIPNGWRGSISLTRFDGTLDQFISDIQDAYFNEGIIQQFTLLLSVLNRDGTVNESLYTGVQFVKPRAGNFRTDKEVDMRLDFRASRRFTVGATTPILTNLAAA